MRTVHKTFCRNCTQGCGLEVVVGDGRAVEIKPDREHEGSEGYFCVKALASLDLHNGAEDRLVDSLKRQPDGRFAAIDGSTAIEEIGDRLRAIIAEHGPRSVAVYMGTGGYYNSLVQPLAKSWLHEVGSPNFSTSSTVDQSAMWVSMMRMGFMASGKYSPAEADVLMMVGANPLVSHFLSAFNPAKSLRGWKARGAKSIVVDPRRTETARLADIHLQLRPGEDVTLLAGMIRVVLENGWEDAAFCDRYATNVATLRAAVAPYTPDYVERRAGVAPDALVEATRVFATSGKTAVFTGTGLAMAPHSNLAMHMAYAINALCGGWRKPGETAYNPGILLPQTFSDMVIPPSRPWEQGYQCHSVPAGKIYGEVPTGALPDEILTPGEGKIRAMIVLGGNPVKALGQPEKTLRAFRDLELLVSLDVRMCDTAKLSHYVIAAALPMERHDLTYICEALALPTKPFVQYAAPIVVPPPGVMDETLFFWEIARRMGLQLEYRKVGPGYAYEDVPAGHKVDMAVPPDPALFARWWMEGAAVDFDTLRSRPGGIAPDLPVQTVQAVADGGARMDLCPTDVATELAVVHTEVQDDSYPYRLATRRLLETINSAYLESAPSKRRYPVNPAWMNPDDMLREGYAAGDRIEIASAHGALAGTVQPDKGVQQGMISMAQCWGETDPGDDPDQLRGSFTGRLVSLEEDIEPINRMPIQTGIPVRIRAFV